MAIYFFIGIGGMVGTLLRYGTYILIGAQWNGSFPAATLAVNCLGCFLLPLLTFKLRRNVPQNVQKAVTSGFIGSFTTFSAFSAETIGLIQEGKLFQAFLYVFLSIAGGLLFVHLGIKRGKKR